MCVLWAIVVCVTELHDEYESLAKLSDAQDLKRPVMSLPLVAMSGDMEEVKRLVDDGADVNQPHTVSKAPRVVV